MKISRGLIGTHGHFRRAAAATSDAADEWRYLSAHQEVKEQDHDARSNEANQLEANEANSWANRPSDLVVNGTGDGGGGGDVPPDAEGEDGSDGEEETMETEVIGKLSTQSKNH
jgi:hypothetical protein